MLSSNSDHQVCGEQVGSNEPGGPPSKRDWTQCKSVTIALVLLLATCLSIFLSGSGVPLANACAPAPAAPQSNSTPNCGCGPYPPPTDAVVETVTQWTPVSIANSPYFGQVQASSGLSESVGYSIGVIPLGGGYDSSTTNGQVISAANGEAIGFFQLATWETHHWTNTTCAGNNAGTYSKVTNWGVQQLFSRYVQPGTTSDANAVSQFSVNGYQSIQFDMRFEPSTHTVYTLDTTCASPGQALTASGSSSTSFPSIFLSVSVTIGVVSLDVGEFHLSYSSGTTNEYVYTFNQGQWQYHYLDGTNYLRAFNYLGSGSCSDFGLSASPTSLSIPYDRSGTSSITVSSLNGLTGTVTLSAAQSPLNYNIIACFHGSSCTGVTDSTTVSVPPGGSATADLTITAPCGSAPPGSYAVAVTGASSSPSVSHSISIPITVTPDNYCSGGGSVAAGTLIALADGSQVPVQNLSVGMQLLSYDMTTHQYVLTTINRFTTVQVNNLMIVHTSGGPALRVDQNPAQQVYVKLSDGTITLVPVTVLKIGYDLFQALTQTWVPITGISYVNNGHYIMYDIYTTAPRNYIANGYLDPIKR